MPTICKKFPQSLIIFSVFFALAVLATWPLILNMGTHLPIGTDSLVHYWNGWWSLQAIKSGDLPYFTSYLFHPDGLSMVYHNFAWLQIIAWIIFQPLIGGFTAYNLILILNLALCGFSVFLLVKELVGNRQVAFVSAVIYLAWPHRLTQPSHPNLMSTWAIPLFLFWLTRLVNYRRWQDGLWAGLTLALIGYMRWQLLIGAALVGTIYLLFILPGKVNRRTLVGLALAGGVALVALLPPLFLLANEWRVNPADLFVESDEVTMQTDMLAYLTPASTNPVFGNITQPLYENYYADRGSRYSISPYIGIVPLLLIVAAIWKGPRRQLLPWLVTSLVLILLALGPTLRINGQQFVNFPMPYALAERFVVFRLLREPDRFNIFLALPVAVLSGYGLHQILSSIEKRQRRNLLVLSTVVLILLEYLTIPLTLQPVQTSPIYEQIADEDGDFAIINVPVNPYKSKPSMLAQTVHGRPILQGHSSRYPNDAFTYLESQSWLNAVNQFDEIPPRFEELSWDLNSLANDGFRYIVLQKEQIEPDYLLKWRSYFAINPRYEDDDIVVYPTRLEADRDFSFQAKLLPNFGLLESAISSNCTNPGSEIAVDVAWGSSAPLLSELSVQFALTSSSGSRLLTYDYPISDGSTEEWGDNVVVHRSYTLPLPPDSKPGEYQISASLLQNGQVVGEPVLMADFIIQSNICVLATPPSTTPLNAVFGDAMRLIAYELSHEDEVVDLTLYWRPERRMAEDYKIFVHIFEPATSVPVAQDDAMPRRWTYPTSLWGLNEVIEDTIVISVADILQGEFGIAVGVYDGSTGERLPLVDGSGEEIPDGRLVLPETVFVP
jgi:hypothetical protein